MRQALNGLEVLAGMGAPLTPTMMLALEGASSDLRDAVGALLGVVQHAMKMPTMDRIMTTSMATARTLMIERTGRAAGWQR